MATELEQAETALLDAIQRVAEAARDASDNAIGLEYREGGSVVGKWTIDAEDMGAIRIALHGWTSAGNAYMRAVRAAAKKSEAA